MKIQDFTRCFSGGCSKYSIFFKNFNEFFHIFTTSSSRNSSSFPIIYFSENFLYEISTVNFIHIWWLSRKKKNKEFYSSNSAENINIIQGGSKEGFREDSYWIYWASKKVSRHFKIKIQSFQGISGGFKYFLGSFKEVTSVCWQSFKAWWFRGLFESFRGLSRGKLEQKWEFSLKS